MLATPPAKKNTDSQFFHEISVWTWNWILVNHRDDSRTGKRGDSSRPRLSGGAKAPQLDLPYLVPNAPANCRAWLDRTAEGGCPHMV